MKKLLSMAALAAVAVMSGCGGGGSDTSGFGFLRVINASPDSNADVFFQDQLFVDNLSYEEGAPGDGDAPETVDSGSSSIVVEASEGGEDTTVTRSLNVEPDHVYTAVFAGFLGNTGTNTPRVIVTSDDTDDLNFGQANFRFVQASPAITTDVDLYIVPAGEDYRDFDPVSADLGRYGVSGLIRLNPGNYRFVVTRAGTDDVIVDATDGVQAGTYSTVVALNDNSNEGTLLRGYGADF